MAEPLISVVIPTYNRAHCILQAVETAARQTYRNIEIIVVDDGSTDDTIAVLKKRAQTEPRLRILVQGKNHGVSAARNRGVAEARGDYIAFLDSDDLWARHKLDIQLAALQAVPQEQLTLAVSNLLLRNVVKNRNDITNHFGQPSTGRLVMRCDFIPSTWLLARRTFERVGKFDEAVHCLEDHEWMIRLLRTGGTVVLSEKPLTKYFITRIGAYRKQRESLERIIEKHAGWIYENFPYPFYNAKLLTLTQRILKDTPKNQFTRCAVLVTRIHARKSIHAVYQTWRRWRTGTVETVPNRTESSLTRAPLGHQKRYE